MEKRDSRKHQSPFPNRLLPLQNLKPDAKFCSLAELKTCLDSAQIDSFQKESKDSILKLLEGDRAPEIDERRYTLWKSCRKQMPWESGQLKNKVSSLRVH